MIDECDWGRVAVLERQVITLTAERDALTTVCHESNEVCLCGCPLSEHENYGEDGESCADETHQCVRTSKAVRMIVTRAEQRLATLRARLEQLANDWRNTYVLAADPLTPVFVRKSKKECSDAILALLTPEADHE